MRCSRSIPFAVCAAVALAASGCGNAVVGGAIHGAVFNANKAVSVILPTSTPVPAMTDDGGAASDGGIPMAVKGTALAIIIVDVAGDACSFFTGKRLPQGTQTLLLKMYDVDPTSGATSAPAGPATYNVYAQGTAAPAAAAEAQYVVTDAACAPVPNKIAAGASGSVWVSRVDGTDYAGGASLTFDSGDSITVNFDSAVTCAAALDVAALGAPPSNFNCK